LNFGAKCQEYQDLLAEIKEFQSEPVATINIDEAQDTPGVNSRDEPSVQNHPIGTVALTIIIPPHLDSDEAHYDISFAQPVSLPSVPASALSDSASAEVPGRVEDPQPVQPVHPVPFQRRSGQPFPQPSPVGVHPPPAQPGQVQTVSLRLVRAKSQREPGFYAQKKCRWGAHFSKTRSFHREASYPRVPRQMSGKPHDGRRVRKDCREQPPSGVHPPLPRQAYDFEPKDAQLRAYCLLSTMISHITVIYIANEGGASNCCTL
jgi:hypothetical protein